MDFFFFCLLPSSFYPEFRIAAFAHAVLVPSAVSALVFVWAVLKHRSVRFNFAGLCGGEGLWPHWRLPGAQWPPPLWKDDVWYQKKRRDKLLPGWRRPRAFKGLSDGRKQDSLGWARQPGPAGAVGVFFISWDRETGKPTQSSQDLRLH